MHFNRMKTLDFILVYFFISSISSAYTITPSQSIKDGQNLTSQSETFELGFFSPSSNSKSRYLGMWYKKIPGQTVVWVANRDAPLNDSSGVLMLSEEGNLVILNRTNHIIWSTNSSKAAKNPIVEFLESGNLVLRDGKADEYLWQSFDHPSDTLLPGMKFGWDLRIGLNRYLRSWKSFDDSSLGNFTYAVELTADPEFFIRKGSKKYYRSGPFNGIRDSGSADLKNNSLFVFNFVVNEEEVYFTFRLVNQSIPLRYKLQQNGNEGSVELITWVDQTQSWVPRAPRPRDPCDTYGLCGTGSICDTNDIPYCRCLKGFKPRSPLHYNELDWSMGCEREMPLDCEEGNSFMKLSEVKVPDTMHTLMNTSTSINLEDCRIKCLKNCSCVAHANADISGNGSGCVMWFGDLMDIRRVLGAGQDLYIRSSGLEAGLPKETRSGPERKKADERVIIIISVIFSVSLLGAVIYFIWRKQIMQILLQILQKVISNKRRAHDIFYHPGEKNDDLGLNFFDMDTIVRATHNFSHMSMLGKGGFGCVYKGMLEDGQEIAVKRLSKNSGQGTEEFKNEVMLIARLQHRNLVRLLGLCMEGEEKILVYEYMENKSLDAIIFDKANNFILDWPKRFSIISGISRGLLYLHQDSRFRIIHRDLKASNVLLDGLLNPKISDFGMATLFFASLSILVFFTILTTSADTISPTQSIKDGETLVSPKEEYELGFFNPGTSTNKYLGIWYKKISTPTIVWVANRNFPITDSSGVLKFGTDGILVVVNGSAGIVWSSNVSKAVNPIAQIMDNGNFVIREQGNLDPEQYLWQSFDYPTDTLIPGMKVGWDLKKGLGRYLTSWKNQNDPSLGDYTYGIDLHGIPQGYVYKKNVTILRTGSWNGAQFAGVPGIIQSYIFNFSYTINRDEVSYTFYVKNDSYYSRLVLNYSTGQLQRYTWLGANKVWNMFWYIPNDDCDTYMQCGVYGVCNGDIEISGYPICNCIKGFEPKNGQDWYLREWSGGCVLKTKYECQKTDGFLLMKNMKIPDTSQASVNENWNLDRCGVECRRNCLCKAYATYNVTNGGSGCIIWTDDLRDLRKYADGGQDLYVRVAASEVETSVLPREIVSGKGKKKLAKTIIIISAVSATFILGFSVCFIWRKRMFKNIQVERLVYKAKNQDPPLCEVFVHGKRDYYGEKGDIELNLFDMDTIVRATDNFDNTNLLGQGGFGCVYKGTWDNGQVVAVKRLSKNSGQGAEEFKNEVILIARLQHRNLVRLLGGCVEGEEKMLVYEYMENKGLDSILFNKEYSFLLDWPKRFNIIVGISRGLLYLHQDSRFRIVHRDLKASNVLLDGEMHPKISDFGMARIFGGDDTEAKTKRVVGTYGYMSPEYAMDGLFSVKSDVFSFGVLVLEIISGRRNKGFFCSDDQLNLLGHAWSLWNEGHALEVIDEAMEDTCLPNEALRCIQVGLLCVQERAEDRPTMSSVVLMLSSDSATLPQPKQPGFCFTKSPIDTDSTSTKQESVNKVTVTMLQPR